MVDEPDGTVDNPSDALPVGHGSPAGSGGTVSGGTGRRPAGRALVVVLFTLPAVLLLAIIGVSIAFWVPADTSGAPATVAGTSSPRYIAVPAVAVDQAHRALHDLGAAACAQDSTVRSPSAVTTAVEVLLDFATRYPDGRFRIDDENGTRSPCCWCCAMSSAPVTPCCFRAWKSSCRPICGSRRRTNSPLAFALEVKGES